MLSHTTCPNTIGKSRFAGKTFLQTLFFFLVVTQICFAQWHQQNSGTTLNLNAVTFLDANIGLAIGDSGTIVRTTNGGTVWSIVTSHVANDLGAMCFSDANNGWIVGSGPYPIGDSAVILHTTDGGANWGIQKRLARSALADIHFVDHNLGFAVGWVSPGSWDYSYLLKTTDGGATWTQVNYDSLNVPQRIYFVDANNGWMMRGTCGNGCGGDIRRTTNGGISWSVSVNGYFSDLQVIDSNKATTVRSGGWQVVQTGYAMQTNDGGLTWRTQIIGFDLGTVSVCSITDSIAVVVTHNFAGARDSLYWTTDGGTTWVPRPNPTDEHLSRVYFTDALTGWAVGDNGTILHTTNGGNPVPVELNSFTATANNKEVILNWSTATELNNQGFEVQRKFGANDFVTVGSVKGNGTTTSQNQYTFVDELVDGGKYYYRLKQIDYGGTFEYSNIIEVEVSILDKFTLEQNYPNPFNPVTTIGYVLQDKSYTRLTLLNTLGEEIAALVNEEQDKGYHKVQLDGSKLTSGVYFYRLNAANYVETKKMILLR